MNWFPPHSPSQRNKYLLTRPTAPRLRTVLGVQVLEDRVTPATFTVTNTDNAGPGSLRQAVLDANKTAEADEIVFDSLFQVPQTITLTGGQISVSRTLTITGPGANLVTIARDPTATEFRIFNSTAPSLTLSGMTVQGGKADLGGGLKSTATVVLNSVVFKGNEATVSGGAVYVGQLGRLTIRSSTLSGNTAAFNGGGIYFFNAGTLAVQNSTISGNTTSFTAPGFNLGGGGIYFFGNALEARLQNTTITGNTSAGSGGGVLLNYFTGKLTVENCTITGNSAASTATGQGGGGVAMTAGSGTIDVVSSVVSGNTNAKAADILSPGGVNVNFSAVGDGTGFTLTGANNLAFGTNLKLGTLADNGGPTLTIAPQTGSPLIDAGSNPAFLTTDQRGPSFVRVYNSKADIGAVEVQPPSVLSITTPTPSPTNADDLTFTVVFNQPLTGLSAANFQLTNTGNATGKIGAVTGSGRTWTVPVNSIAGDGTLRLDFANSAGVTAAAVPPGVIAPFTGGQVVVVDNTAPTVLIALLDPNPLDSMTARYEVTFSEPVTGVSIDDFKLTSTGSAVGTLESVSGAGATWVVTAIDVTGTGSLRLDVAANTDIADAAGNLGGAYTGGPSYTVQPMVLSITGPASSSAGTVNFAVVFNQPVAGLTKDNFQAVFTGTASGEVGTPTGSGTTWTVPIIRILGNGTLQLRMENSDGATPTVALLPFTSGEVRIDRILPTVSSITPAGPNPTNGTTVDFTVTFPEVVEGLTADNFALHTDGTLAGVTITNVADGGATWTVSVSTGTGDGSIRLDVVNDDGNVFPPIDGLPFTGGTPVVVDRTDPVAQATAPAGANPTNAGTAQFAVTFSEPVVGVTAANFTLLAAGVNGAVITGLAGSGATYTVTVSTGSGDGTLQLALATPSGIADLAGNPLTGQQFTATPLTVDKSFPTAQSIARVGPAATNAATVSFTITFSEPVRGVAPLNFAIVTSGTLAGAALTSLTTTDGRVYTAVVSTGAGDGTLRLDLFSPVGITDATGQPVIAGLTGESVTVDRTAPLAAVTLSTGQEAVTGDLPIRFTLTFNEPVAGFGRDDVVLGGTAGPGVVRVTGSGATYEVEVSGLSASGDVVLSVRGEAAVDAAGNLSLPTDPAAHKAVLFVRKTGGGADAYPTRALTPLTVAAPGVLANDIDPDGRPLTAVLVTAPPAAAGTVQLNPDGSFTFRPAVGFVGSASFTYAPFNGFVTGTATTVTILVGPGQGLSAVAAGPGGGPQVTVYNADGTVRFNFFVYTPTFSGGVYVATGDLTGDGVEDVVTGAGLGGGPHVRVFDGATGAEVSSFFAYDPSVRGGVTVAVGDVDGDGRADLITGAGPGAGPHVKVFNGATGAELFGFFAYDPSFTGGVSVAAGDLNGDRVADIATGPLEGGGPHVQVFDGRTRQVLMSFFAFDPKSRGGASVAIGDAYADGTAELFAGAGTGSAVRVFRGDGNGVQLTGFFLADPVSAKAVRVATDDTDGDGRTDQLLVASGPGTSPIVRRYDLSDFARIDDLLNFPANFLGGLFVG